MTTHILSWVTIKFLLIKVSLLYVIPWCWGRLRAGGEGGIRGWDGWIASLTQWTWVWENSERWWRTGKPGVLQSEVAKSQTWLSDWTENMSDCVDIYYLFWLYQTFKGSLNWGVNSQDPITCKNWNQPLTPTPYKAAQLEIQMSFRTRTAPAPGGEGKWRSHDILLEICNNLRFHSFPLSSGSVWRIHISGGTMLSSQNRFPVYL